jgi:hypothetical protein
MIEKRDLDHLEHLSDFFFYLWRKVWRRCTVEPVDDVGCMFVIAVEA